MTNRPKNLYWVGERDANGQPLEYFGVGPGGREPIPAMDLGPDETAQLTEAQWEALDSPTGRRLYRRTEPDAKTKAAASDGAASEADPSSTAAPSADGSS